MAKSNEPGATGEGAQMLAGIAVDALPPELQSLFKPGKTSNRIQHAITWAARPDPVVVKLHQARDKRVHRFEDIRSGQLANMDGVARTIARRYRHRAAWTGAITNLPGGLWSLVAAGVDVQLTAVYAVRMAAMVAQAYGYDTSLLEEQAHLADVLALAAGVDSLRGVGNWLTREGLTHLLPEILPKVLTRISIELTEEQAARWMGRIIPGVGAVIGGTIDYTFLRAAGERAITYYHTRYMQEHGMLPPVQMQRALPPGLQPTPIFVDGSLAQPVLPVGAGQVTPALPQPQPVRKTPRRRSPERYPVYLAIFTLIALLITIAACYALLFLATVGVHHLLGH